MKAERRDFLRTAITGTALSLASHGRALGQSSAKARGELQTGSGTLYLEGLLKVGNLKLEAQDLLDRMDRSVIIRSKLELRSGSDPRELYSAMFSYRKDYTVFALFQDHDHSTIVVLCDSDNVKVGRAVVWNDGDTPQIHDFEKAKILAANNIQEFVDINGKIPNLIGKREPPLFTPKELESVFGSDPELLAFMRGKKSTHSRRDDDEWMCWFLSNVPGSTLSLIWRA